jgi:adenine-specific DNA-methyltransferase
MSYRYLGNKARIAEWIGSVVKEHLAPGSAIADPMCGTATMSETFARHGYRVIASDELKFPTLHAKARLLSHSRGSFDPVARSYEHAISILNNLEPIHGFFWREYSDEGTPLNGTKPRRYFTGENAGRIDAARKLIREWRGTGLAPDACDLLLHDLILAANRVANIAGTYGYYRSTWNKASLARLKIEPTPAVPYSLQHAVMQGRIQDLANEIEADAFYIDPPYTKRQYGGNYHILETIAVEDEPTPVGDGGLRDWYGQASDFCYRRLAGPAFEATISNISAPWVFVSYSEDAHLGPDELFDLLSHFGGVTRRAIPLERFRSNSRVAKKGAVEEHLYVVEMYNARAAETGGTMVSADQGERSLQHRKVAA